MRGLKFKIHNSKLTIAALAVTIALLSIAPFVEAQQPGKIWRIGVLASGSQSLNASRNEALRQGLREFGYLEGKNVIIEYRYAEGKLDRLPELAADLVRQKADVIVVGGTRVALAAKKATGTIPIVIAGAGDPVPAGLVASYMRPGGNVTGVSRLSPDFIGRRIALVKEAIPKTARMAILFNLGNPGYEAGLKELELGARARGMVPQSAAVRSPGDFDGAFDNAAKGGADALLLMPDALFHSYLTRIVGLAAKSRLPAMYDRAEFVEAGGLMSYAVDLADLARRAAWYVDQILKGAKPAELPLVEPTRYGLAINLKTAGALGLRIPPEVLAKADKVIK